MKAPAVKVVEANLIYQDLHLFKDLSIEFPASCFNCLLGISGVGKTSLLRLIAGLHVDLGSAHSNVDHRVAYLAQEENLLPWLTTLGNVLLGFHLRGNKNIKAHREKALQLLNEVGLKNAIHKRPEQLSGGMRQRVALVRTLIEDRPIILMDEPFAKLDALTRMELQDLAIKLLKDRTVVMVTHDPFEALRIADNIYVMSGQPATIEKVSESQILQQYSYLLSNIRRSSFYHEEKES